jgi:Flp pilus assembly protein TadG
MRLTSCRDPGPSRRGGSPRRGARARTRAGAAVVEFAIVATLLGAVVAGLIELSRAATAKEALSNASRRGASIAIKNAKTYTDIQNAVDDILATDGQLPATLANGKAHLVVTVATWDSVHQTYGSDVTVTSNTFAPQQFDKVGVQVWANASDCGLILSNFMTGLIESETVYMMKQ